MIVIILFFSTSISCAPAQEYKVILMLGQSNMVGFGRISDFNSIIQGLPEGVREKVTIPPYFIWEDLGESRKDAKVWKSLVSHRDTSKNIFQFLPLYGGNTSTHGSELGLAYKLKQYHPDTNLAFIKIAVNGTNLASDWRPSESQQDSGGLVYKRFEEGFNLAIEQAYEAILESQGEGENIAIEVVGILWMQGESDTKEKEKAKAYQTNLENFITKVRDVVHNTNKDFIVNKPHTPKTPFIIGLIMDQKSLDDNCTAPDIPSVIRLDYADTIRLSQQKVCDSIDRCMYFDTKDYPRACGYNSEIHYNSQGLIQMGFDFAQSLNDLLR